MAGGRSLVPLVTSEEKTRASGLCRGDQSRVKRRAVGSGEDSGPASICQAFRNPSTGQAKASPES